MSEEEIINNIKKQIENTKKANECGLATKGEFKEDIEALQGLLDLYNKEKEKNIELEEFGEHIKIFREKNLSSEIDYVIALKSNFMGYLKTDYISKDEIKAKIEEVKDGTFDAKIVLQSLLEKE